MAYTRGVSVVIATHNGSMFIRDQLNSIINQTVNPLEIIVCDDDSKDSTMDIVIELAAISTIPFKLIKNSPALGFRANFLRGALLACGNFVAFCDQDDVWDQKKIESCGPYLDDRTVSMIVHAAICVDSDNRELATFQQGIQRSGLRPPLSYDPWLTFFGFSMVFRRELLDLWDVEDRFIDFIVPSESIAHDRWVMFLAQVVGKTVEINVSLVRYRQHSNNLFGDGKRKRHDKRRTVAGELDPYRDATGAMIWIVEHLPESTNQHFPLFDRARAVLFLRRALHQLDERETIYRSATHLEALKRVARQIFSGNYQAVHNGRTRWKSIVKDLRFAIFRY